MAKVAGTSSVFPNVVVSGPKCMDCDVTPKGPLAARLVLVDGIVGIEIGILEEGFAHAVVRVTLSELLKDLV